MNEMDMMSPEKVAAKYNGDKQKIGQAAQMGLLNPTVAVMAGMFIDRMRGAAAQEQAPQSTVAQDTMAPAQAAPAGLGAISQAPMESGLEALPTPNLDNAEYAGGGIVAFQGGGMSQIESDQAAMVDTLKRMGYSMADIATMVPRGLMGAFNAGVLRPARAITGLDIPYAKDILAPEGSNFSSMTPFYDQLRGSKAPPPLKDLPQVQAGYPDETTRGTARRVAQGGPGRSMEEFGIGAAEMAARRDADEAAKKAGAGKGAAPAKKEETSEDMLDRIQKMRKRAGVSEDPFAADREALRARMDDIASQDKENKALAMIMGGLSGVNARNLAEFAQKAGTAGFGQYMKGKEKTREEQKEIDKINRDLNKAEDAMKRGDVDKALEFEDKAAQRQIQLRGVQAQERSAGRPSSTAELMAALQSPNPKVRAAAESILGRGKTGVIDERFLMERWEKMNPVEKLKLQQQGIGYDQWAASKRAESGGAAGAPAAGGRVIDFGSIR
jgi:hypothetical protein